MNILEKVQEKLRNNRRNKLALEFAKSLVCANPEYVHGNIPAPVPDYVMKLSFEYADAYLYEMGINDEV